MTKKFSLHEHTFLVWFCPSKLTSLNMGLIGVYISGFSWNTGSHLYAAGATDTNKPVWKSYGQKWYDRTANKAVLVKDNWSFLALTFDGSETLKF